MVKLCSCKAFPYYHTHEPAGNDNIAENNSKNDAPEPKQLDIVEGCEAIERKKLVGFCEKCQEWYKFIDVVADPSSRLCPNCGNTPSYRTGFQLTTQRTFNPKARKMTKAQLKKMGGGS